MPKAFTSIVMVAVVMGQDSTYGNCNWLNSPKLPDWKLLYLIFRQEPQNGTKLSTGCFAMCQKNGQDNR